MQEPANVCSWCFLRTCDKSEMDAKGVKEATLMPKTWTIGHRSLAGHGFLMLGAGIATCSLASLMASADTERLSYIISAALVAVSLLLPSVYLGVQAFKERSYRVLLSYVIAAYSTSAAWLVLWLIMSSPTDIRVLSLLAGLHGIFWSMWYLRIAHYLREYPAKSSLMCILAATTSLLGIVIATQSRSSTISSATEVSCYMMFTGSEILITTIYVYSQCGVARELPPLLRSKWLQGRLVREARNKEVLITSGR